MLYQFQNVLEPLEISSWSNSVGEALLKVLVPNNYMLQNNEPEVSNRNSVKTFITHKNKKFYNIHIQFLWVKT